jgi:hypothetical protein
MHLLAESLNLHVISTAWDLQFLKCLAESTQPKSSIVDVTEMRSGDKATKTGKLFYDTLKVRKHYHSNVQLVSKYRTNLAMKKHPVLGAGVQSAYLSSNFNFNLEKQVQY